MRASGLWKLRLPADITNDERHRRGSRCRAGRNPLGRDPRQRERVSQIHPTPGRRGRPHLDRRPQGPVAHLSAESQSCTGVSARCRALEQSTPWTGDDLIDGPAQRSPGGDQRGLRAARRPSRVCLCRQRPSVAVSAGEVRRQLRLRRAQGKHPLRAPGPVRHGHGGDHRPGVERSTLQPGRTCDETDRGLLRSRR
jgi:hypothetical protein